MRSGLRLLAGLCLALVLLAGGALAGDTWKVVRGVRLLTKPSSVSGQRIKTLHPGDLVYPTGGRHGNYMRVLDDSDDAGWVYAPYLVEVPEVEPTEPPEGSPAAPDTVGVADALSSSWDRPTPQVSNFRLHGRVCGPTGSGGDTETNRRKNRTDIPTRYHAVTFEAVDRLPYPADAPTKRSGWTSAQLAAIEPYEGAALTVTGYLVALKPQRGNSESCNCGWTGADETDWHMALAGRPGGKELEKESMVVETTPRIRIDHPMWTPSNLAPWTNGPNPIRVSGWLMMDPQHKNHIGRYRNTLWEIHPVTKIEVMQDSVWMDLDRLQGGPG